MNNLNLTWHHIRRSPFQSLTAILVMVLCFFSLTFFLIVSDGFSVVLNYFETKPEVTIFLKDGLDRNTIDSIQKDLSSYKSIKEIKYISKEKALTLYQDQNKDNPLLTEMVTSSILPASFEISVSDPKVLEQIASDFSSKKDTVDEIIYQKDIIDSLLNWTKIIRSVGLIIVSTIGTIGFLIIFIIVGMKITNRKDEIRISRLLGASRFYVIKPFLLEGIFYGVLGSLIGSLVCFILAFYFSQRINIFFQPIIFIRSELNIYLIFLLAEIILGIVIGYLASWVGAKRYIKF